VPDLLTHVLLAYSTCLVLSWHVEWLDPPYVTVAMVGATVPDLSKVGVIVSSWQIRRLIGVPFSWTSLHTVGGVGLSILLATTLVGRPYRRPVAILLAIGAATHLLADSMLRSVTDRLFPLLWPLTSYVPPTPDLYLSTDPWLAVAAGLLAAILTGITRYRNRDGRGATHPPDGDG